MGRVFGLTLTISAGQGASRTFAVHVLHVFCSTKPLADSYAPRRALEFHPMSHSTPDNPLSGKHILAPSYFVATRILSPLISRIIRK